MFNPRLRRRKKREKKEERVVSAVVIRGTRNVIFKILENSVRVVEDQASKEVRSSFSCTRLFLSFSKITTTTIGGGSHHRPPLSWWQWVVVFHVFGSLGVFGVVMV